MSQVVKTNRGFLQLLAVCPAHPHQFLLRTGRLQELHALVQVAIKKETTLKVTHLKRTFHLYLSR